MCPPDALIADLTSCHHHTPNPPRLPFAAEQIVRNFVQDTIDVSELRKLTTAWHEMHSIFHIIDKTDLIVITSAIRIDFSDANIAWRASQRCVSVYLLHNLKSHLQGIIANAGIKLYLELLTHLQRGLDDKGPSQAHDGLGPLATV